MSYEEGEEHPWWGVEHWWNGKINHVVFNSKEKAITYAASKHTTAFPLYKAEYFYEQINLASSEERSGNE